MKRLLHLLVALVALALFAPKIVAAQGQLIGSYVINYRYNAAGRLGDPNPYYDLDPIGPGPYFINATPGRYKVVITGMTGRSGHEAIWSGNSAGGTSYSTGPDVHVGTTVIFDHTFGQIVLYAYDWYVYDNDPLDTTSLELYRLDSLGSNVQAWGNNTYGQLGDGTTTDRHTPGTVNDLTNVLSISSGHRHNLARKSDGTIWTWGYNQFGQLGDGTTTTRYTPVQVVGLSGIVAVSGGVHHSMALKADGTIWAWGYNGNGRLGDSTQTERDTPVQVLDLSNVTAIEASHEHSMALRSDGTVWAWGRNYFGALGDGTTTDRLRPIQVNGLNNIIAIAAGNAYGMALKSDGTVWAWGYNAYGQLGDGTTTTRYTPAPIPGLTNVVAIASSTYGFHNLAIKSDGTLWAWGSNSNGQLGDGSTNDRYTPEQITGLSNVVKIACGMNHSMVLTSDGTVWAWGYNEFGQLGDGTTSDRHIPAPVPSLTNVVAVKGGRLHTIVLQSARSTLRGTVSFEEMDSQAPAQRVSFEFRPVDGGAAPFTRTTDVASGVPFTLTDIPSQAYNLRIKGAKWLTKNVAVNASGGDVLNVMATLSGGDADNNNIVDIRDFGLLVNAYGGDSAVPGSGYDAAADFNCDGVNDIGDFGLLVNNYGSLGDP